MSLGFLESLPACLATPIPILAFAAYSLSLNCHKKELQGCLELYAPEKCLFAYSELICNSKCIIFCKYIYYTCIDIFYLSLPSMELIIGS